MKKISRRTFIKSAAVVGTAFAASPIIFVPKARASYAKKTLIHPNVDNLRVVGITDPSMAKAEEVGIDWVRQEELVAQKPVWENIDRLACALTDLRNPEQAWKSIFIKPPQKSWSEAVVAMTPATEVTCQKKLRSKGFPKASESRTNGEEAIRTLSSLLPGEAGMISRSASNILWMGPWIFLSTSRCARATAELTGASP